MTRNTTREIMKEAERARTQKLDPHANPLLDADDEGEFAAEEAADDFASDEFNPLLDADEEADEHGYTPPDEAISLEDFALPGVGSLRRQDPKPTPRVVERNPEPELTPSEPTAYTAEEPDSAEDTLGLDDIDSLLGFKPTVDLADDETDELFDEDIREIFEAATTPAADTSSPGFQEAWGDLDDDLLNDDDYGDEDEDEFAGFHLDTVLGEAIDLGASDVDIQADDQVGYSILGEMSRADKYGVISGAVTQRLQQNIISHVLESEFVYELELDTSYVLKSGPHRGRRTRLSIGRSKGEIFLVFRVIADEIPTPEDLGITGELLEWVKLANGLVLVCGPTGTGKSTTFASMVNEINLTRPQKIITLEKPIEYVYGRGKAFITQREIGRDARAFEKALTSAMRQHPNIIMVGEVRNQVEISELLRASESGHLAMSTMHTNSAAATINRIQSLYEGDEQKRILGSLADNLRGIANQVLIKTKDGDSRFAVREVLSIDQELSSMVLKGDTRAIRAYQIEREATMEHELVKAVVAGRCYREAAREQSPFPSYFDELLAAQG